MLKIILAISSLIYLVSGTGQFIVVRAPSSLQFSGSDAIDGHDLPEVLSASLGFTSRRGSKWPGLNIKDPFGFADAVTVVAVDGVSSLGDFEKLPVYPMDPVISEYPVWRALQDDVLEHYPTIYKEKKIVRVDFSEDDSGISVDTRDLNTDNLIDEDWFCLQDIALLKSHVARIEKNGVQIDEPQVNWFALSSLHAVSDVRGSDDQTVLKLKKMLRQVILDLGKAMDEATKGRALVAVIVSDGAHTRLVRAAGDNPGNGSAPLSRATAASTKEAPLNRATAFTTSYPAIFNIMLWFGVSFVLSLIAISYFIATMDPGRDSIIYRMTSNRMKKDS